MFGGTFTKHMKTAKLALLSILLTPLALYAFSFNPINWFSKSQVTPIELGDTINTIDQWTPTTSPTSAITQRTFGKTIKITGLTAGQCLKLDADNLLISTSCGTGGGGSELNWSFFNNSGIRLGTTSNQVLISGTGTGVSTTTSSKLEVGYESTANGSLLALGSTTLQNFTFLNATGSKATTTSLFSTLGNFNTLCIALDCKTAWPTSGTGASTTLLADNNTFTGNNTFGKATSSSFAITSIASKLLKTDANGNIS